MKKFNNLFWLIFTEHIGLQIIMYSVMFLLPLILFLQEGYNLYDSLTVSLIIPVGMKTLSTLSALLKTWFIIKKCKDNNLRFKEIYKEWTGDNFQP